MLPAIDARECDPDGMAEVCLTIPSAGDLGSYVRQMEREKAVILACPLVKVGQ